MNANASIASDAARRETAIDIARAIAILGMMTTHAILVLANEIPYAGSAGIVFWLCDGRAAAAFVTLAGFGVAQLMAHDPVRGAALLRRRALVLWCVGVLNLIVWEGDILRIYGVALLLAPWLLQLSTRSRLALAVALVMTFPVLAHLFDWARHWDLVALTYRELWTPAGFLRNQVFDGFRPLIPWLAFFMVGTVLAGHNLRDPSEQRWLIAGGAALLLATFALSWLFVTAAPGLTPDLPAEEREVLFGTGSLPPLPLFMASAFATTAMLLGLVGGLANRLPANVLEPLAATGRRALTWYLVHIAVLVAIYGLGGGQSVAPWTAIGIGLAMFACAVIWSYRYRHTRGSLERGLRALSRVPRTDTTPSRAADM